MTDNITYTSYVTESILFRDFQWSMLFIVIGLTLLFGIVLLIITRSRLLMYFGITVGIAFSSISGFIPMWITAMMGVIMLTNIYFYISTPIQQGETETGDYWADYGNKMKLAYSAKFGGANPAFNQEVDNHIAIMQHNGKGITRTLANEWINRYSKFVECK